MFHSRNTLISNWVFLGNAFSFYFLPTSENQPTEVSSNNNRDIFSLYNVWSIGIDDQQLNLAPLFALNWFTDAFIALSGCRCFYSNSMWNLLFHLPVYKICNYVLTKVWTSISIKHRLYENIKILSSIAHGFCSFTISNLVTDLHDAWSEKLHRECPQGFVDRPENSSKK